MHDAYSIGDHTLFVGKVVAARSRRTPSTRRGCSPTRTSSPLHYLGVNYYAVLGERLEARIPQPADIKRDVEAGEAQLGDEGDSERRREEEARRAERGDAEEE